MKICTFHYVEKTKDAASCVHFSNARTRVKHCHPLVDELKGTFKSQHLCELAALMLLLGLVVAHKQRFFEAGARKRSSRFDCVSIAERRCDFHWRLLRLAPESPARHQLSPRSAFCVAFLFPFRPQILRATGLSDLNQRALHSVPVRAPPFSKQCAHGRNLQLCGRSCASGGIKVIISLIVSIFLLRTLQWRTRVLGSTRSAFADCLTSLASSLVWCGQLSSRLATSFTFSFSVRLGDKDAFGDVRSAAFQRR